MKFNHTETNNDNEAKKNEIIIREKMSLKFWKKGEGTSSHISFPATMEGWI